MTALRPLSPDDGPDVYALLQSIPAEENGLMNAAHGMDFEQYRAWLRAQYESARQVGLRDGYKVPQTTYWLVADGRPVGLGRLRHFLTAALREDGGNLAYAVAPAERGKGYGKAILRGLIAEAGRLGLDRALLVIHEDNAPSLRTALSCGGRVARTENGRHYVWAACESALRVEPTDDRELFANLFNVYINELAAYRPRLGRGVDARGNMLPQVVTEDFTDPCKHPCVIRLGEKPVGLLVWSEPGPADEADGCACYVEELFILPSFRRLGLGEQALRACLARRHGVCGACIYKANEASQRLLERVCAAGQIPLRRGDGADAGMYFYRAALDG